jgi:hypothetical protein
MQTKEQHRAWRLKNRERLKERKRIYDIQYARNNKGKRREINMRWRAENKEYLRYYCRMRRYGLSFEQVKNILTNSENKCQICNSQLDDTRAGKPHIDHNHITGKVRGILCGNCNRGLGYFHDNIETMGSAIEYLQLFN